MKRLLLALLALPVLAQGAEPFLIFASDAAYTDAATMPLIQRYLSSQDYLGYRAVLRTRALRGTVPAAHTVEVTPTLAGLQQVLQAGCAMGPG